jgi:SAM-dependent methyltransferase
MQFHRLNDLYAQVGKPDELPRFITERRGRTLSSIEEELVSRLPLFDEKEQQEMQDQAIAIVAPSGISFPDSRAFDVVDARNPELGKKLRSLGLQNFQHLMQMDFYRAAARILEETKSREFKASYEKVTPLKFAGINAACLEVYNYGGAVSYRSMLYMLLRHLTNLSGGESELEIRAKARSAFSGKRVLELGSGPGFFLSLLQNFGAKVIGVDENRQLEEKVKQRDVPIVIGDAKDLKRLVGDERFDIVISKDFLSYAVTKEDAGPILQTAYDVTASRGLSVHQIDYSRSSEEAYFAHVAKAAANHQLNQEAIRKTFARLTEEQKDILLRKNIFNIGPGSLARIGYKILTFPRLDAEFNLAAVLQKP